MPSMSRGRAIRWGLHLTRCASATPSEVSMCSVPIIIQPRSVGNSNCIQFCSQPLVYHDQAACFPGTCGVSGTLERLNVPPIGARETRVSCGMGECRILRPRTFLVSRKKWPRSARRWRAIPHALLPASHEVFFNAIDKTLAMVAHGERSGHVHRRTSRCG